jgi:hypothetical protein
MSALFGALRLTMLVTGIGCALPAAAAVQVQDMTPPASALAPPALPSTPPPPPAASTPAASETPPSASPILYVRLRTDTAPEREWLAGRLAAGLRSSPMSFQALAHSAEKIRGETDFRDSSVLPDPYRESGAVILLIRNGSMGLDLFLELGELRVNFYNDSTQKRLKALTPAQELRYRVSLAEHLRPILTRACGDGVAYRCSVS